MPDYNAAHHGEGVMPSLIQMKQVVTSTSSWVPSSDVDPFRPVRAMRIQIPAYLLAEDAKGLADWATPATDGVARARAYDAVASLFFAGTSKGVESGNHCELDACANEESASQAGDGKSESKGKQGYSQYVFTGAHGARTSMFTFGLEEITSPDGELVAYGLWKFVADAGHSDTKLVSAIIEESRATADSLRATRVLAQKRKPSLMREARSTAALMSNGTLGAGLGYTRVSSTNHFLQELKTMGSGRVGVSRGFFGRETLPFDTLTSQMRSDALLGGTHPLSPEYLFNARRPKALSAGLIGKHGELLDADEQLMDPSTYFNASGMFVADPDTVTMHFLADPSALNLYDFAFPNGRLDGLGSPGPTLMRLFLEEHCGQIPRAPAADAAGPSAAGAMGPPPPVGAPAAEVSQRERKAAERRNLALFREYVTQTSALPSATNTSFDCLDPAVAAVASGHGGLVREQPCPLRRVRSYTNRLRSGVVVAWQRDALARLNRKYPSASGARPAAYRTAADAIQRDYETATRELLDMHLESISAAFVAQDERAKLPPGFVAQVDGLHEAVRDNDGSASVAFGARHNRQRMMRDRSPFAETWSFIGSVWRDDGKVDGRDRQIMDEVFMTVFETQAPKTFFTIVSGGFGNGKSVRSERAAGIFPNGVFADAGSASAKTGANGKADHRMNGRCVVYDEMNRDLIAVDSTKLEFYKQVCQKRSWTHERSELVPVGGGTDQYKTVVINTDHRSSQVILTNHGFTYIDSRHSHVPDDSRRALISRSVFQLARSSTTHKSRAADEFREHMALPETQTRVNAFRLIVSLSLAVRMAIEEVPFLKPDLSHANEVLALMDQMLARYGLPQPTARKRERREQVMITLAILDAVSRVFVYKQTSVDFEAGRPWFDEAGATRAQKWNWKQLGDVISTLCISPEVILMSWSFGLDYTLGTSSCGFAALSVLCDYFGLGTDAMLRTPHGEQPISTMRTRAPRSNTVPCNSMHAVAGSSKTALSPSIMLAQGSKLEAALARAEERLSALLAAGSDPNGETARAVDDEIARIRATQTSLRTRLHQQHLEGAPPANLMQDPPFLLDKRTTATSAGIAAAAARLRTLREKRHKFRSECDAHAAMGNPKTFAESNNVEIDDFMPSALEALTLYSSRTLASWMNRGESEGSGGAWGSRSQVTKFKEIVAADERTDTAAVFDFSTLADPTAGKTFKDVAASLCRYTSAAGFFGLSEVVLRDVLIMFSLGGEGDRMCTDAPVLADAMRPELAHTAGHEGRPVPCPGVNRSVAIREPLQKITDADTFASAIQRMASSGRLPLLNGVFSNAAAMRAPVACSEAAGIQLNVSAALSHVSFMAEAILATSQIAGYDRPERQSGGPAGLRRTESADDPQPGQETISQLPFGLDTPTVFLTAQAAKLFVHDYEPPGIRAACDEYGVRLDDKPFDLTHRFEGVTDVRLLSSPLSTSSDAADAAVAAAPPPEREYTAAYVSAANGRQATEEEVRRYNQARAGDRRVVKKPLSTASFVNFTLKSLRERGLRNSDSTRSICDIVTGARAKMLNDLAQVGGGGLDIGYLELAPLVFDTHSRAPSATVNSENAAAESMDVDTFGDSSPSFDHLPKRQRVVS